MYIVNSLVVHQDLERSVLFLTKKREEVMEFMSDFPKLYPENYVRFVQDNQDSIEISEIKGNLSKIHVLEFYKIKNPDPGKENLINKDGKIYEGHLSYSSSKEYILIEAIKLFMEVSIYYGPKEVIKMRKCLEKTGKYVIPNPKDKKYVYEIKMYKIKS